MEAVALALGGKSAPPAKAGDEKSKPKTAEDWLEKRIEGVSAISKGAILLAVTLLIGVALALFVPAEVPWMLVWLVFFGWMACWGGIEMANGIGAVIESKSRLRVLGAAGVRPAIDSTTRELLSGGEPTTTANTSAAFRSSPPSSVTEGTTRHFDDPVGK